MEEFQITGEKTNTNPHSVLQTQKCSELWIWISALIISYSQRFFPLFEDVNMQNETAST